MSLQQKILAEKMKLKREERKPIKELFVDSGIYADIINKIEEKAKPTIKPENLPF